jgi:hypothetical protein
MHATPGIQAPPRTFWRRLTATVVDLRFAVDQVCECVGTRAEMGMHAREGRASQVKRLVASGSDSDGAHRSPRTLVFFFKKNHQGLRQAMAYLLLSGKRFSRDTYSFSLAFQPCSKFATCVVGVLIN